VSLLSPKKIHVGLCCGKCWLQVGELQVERTTEIDITVDPAALQHFFVQALSSMLAEVKSKIKPRSSVSITVSDRLAMISTLPWQETAMSQSELESFAIFWLAKFGMKVDESQLLFANYPRYQAVGLAYALPKVFVETLASMVDSVQLKLERVIPLSAEVFFSTYFKKVRSSTIVVCEETHSLSAWIFDQDEKIHYEIEPITATQDQAIKRLSSRISLRYTELENLDFWGVAKDRVPSEMRDHFPLVKSVNKLERECWNKP
jgi:hypothetical protein